MTFSVVIPMYNAEKTIVSSIESCLQQTLSPLEVIVVDDASSDKSCELVESKFGSRVQILRQEENKGPSVARNKGWNISKGDYVVFLDSDDRFHPRKLAICAEILEANDSIDLLWHPFQTETLPNYITGVDHSIKQTILRSLLIANKVSSSAIVFKTNLHIRFDEKMRYCEDYDLALRTVYKFRVWHSPLVLTQLGRPLLSPGGFSNNLAQMRLGEMTAYYKLRKLNFGFYFLIPFLFIWSSLKHLRVLIR